MKFPSERKFIYFGAKYWLAMTTKENRTETGPVCLLLWPQRRCCPDGLDPSIPSPGDTADGVAFAIDYSIVVP